MQKTDIAERRKTSTHLIDSMLAERKQLLSLLVQLSELDAESQDDADGDLLQDFCQVLVDYIAAGHFGLYQRLASDSERRREVLAVSKKVYEQIEKTTQAALEFNEKYDVDNKNLSSLTGDLSWLGEMLTTRIELEDQLIEKML